MILSYINPNENLGHLDCDVIISRLRPYLRQAAIIDQGLVADDNVSSMILCSTEFYVLRSKDDRRCILGAFPFEHKRSAALERCTGGRIPSRLTSKP